jgi:hypothetical protein
MEGHKRARGEIRSMRRTLLICSEVPVIACHTGSFINSMSLTVSRVRESGYRNAQQNRYSNPSDQVTEASHVSALIVCNLISSAHYEC